MPSEWPGVARIVPLPITTWTSIGIRLKNRHPRPGKKPTYGVIGDMIIAKEDAMETAIKQGEAWGRHYQPTQAARIIILI